MLEKFRATRAYERKIKKAKAKKAHHAVDRLEERKPQYGLDHLVKERYPSFVDAIRDLDDPLTLVHLFALLPADKRHGIPAEVVNRSRALALEFQSYVTKTHSLRKVFISVKGIYYQASIYGQEVTWLTPHALSQTLPEDVDYRVMLTFLEFYVAMMGFVNYKLYYDRSFRYPPLLDTRLEDAAGGIVAVIHDLADKVHGETTGARAIAGAAKKTSERAAATEARLGSLKEKMAAFADAEVDDEEAAAAAAAARDSDDDEDPDGPDTPAAAPEAEDPDMEDVIAASAGADPVAREDAKLCATLFKGLVFFIQREVPRDMMVFIIRSFGGEVCWEGEGSPYDESDGGVTHHVCDRPMEGRMNARASTCSRSGWRIASTGACSSPPRTTPRANPRRLTSPRSSTRRTKDTPQITRRPCSGCRRRPRRRGRGARSPTPRRRLGDASAHREGGGRGGGTRARQGSRPRGEGYPVLALAPGGRGGVLRRRVRVRRRGSRGGRRRGGVRVGRRFGGGGGGFGGGGGGRIQGAQET